MIFYNSTTKQGICQKIDDICDSDDTSYTRQAKTREVNTAYERVVGWIINADGTAQFDDTNYSDFPIGTYNLVNSQGKYSFNDKFLQIINVKIKDQDGNWSIIKPIDQADLDGVTPLEELYENDGSPIFYDKLTDDTIQLYPAPDNGISVTLVSGLKIYFKRTANLFTVASNTDTDSTAPGFVSTYHEILAYMASIPYLAKYHPDRINMTKQTIIEIKDDLLKGLSQKEKDRPAIITVKETSYV